MRRFLSAILLVLSTSLLGAGCQQRDYASEMRANDPAVRVEAIRLFTVSLAVDHRIGSCEVKKMVPILIECLRDSEPTVREEAIQALAQVGPAAKQALTDACRHDEPRIRSGAISAMGRVNERLYERQFQPRDDEYLFVLVIGGLSDTDARVRKSAAWSLPALRLREPKTKQGLKCLLKALDDSDAKVRGTAARAIGEWADKPGNHELFETAVKRIGRFLKEEDRDTRLCAIISLYGLTRATKSAVPALASALRDDDQTVRASVYFHLSQLSSKKVLVTPFLFKAFDDNNEENRLHIMRTLQSLGPLPDSSAPFLMNALKDDSPRVRLIAVMVLGDMAHPPPKSIPVLREMLTKASPRTKVSVAWTLYKAGEKKEVFLPPLLAGLQDGDARVREDSANTLGNMGVAAKSAVPALERLGKDDSDEKVKEIANSALHRILIASGE